MRKYNQSREKRFLDLEKEALKQLPDRPYQYCSWKTAKVHPDGHIQVAHNYYSVPYQYRGKEVAVRSSNEYLEIFDNLDRICIHSRFQGSSRGRYKTLDQHLPESHLAIKEFTVIRALQQAEKIEPATHLIFESLIHESKHPLQYLRRCQGILRLGGKHGSESLESTCSESLELGIHHPSHRQIENFILAAASRNLRQRPVPSRQENPNLRGQNTWKRI